MNKIKNDVIVKIIDRSFSIKCAPEEISDLHEAATLLNSKIQEGVKNQKIYNNEIISIDRLIITALNISHELLMQRKQNLSCIADVNKKLVDLEEKIDQTLELKPDLL
jgi:cell division protein ZapA